MWEQHPEWRERTAAGVYTDLNLVASHFDGRYRREPKERQRQAKRILCGAEGWKESAGGQHHE